MRWRRLMRTPLRWWGVLLVLVVFSLFMWLTEPWGPAFCSGCCVLSELGKLMRAQAERERQKRAEQWARAVLAQVVWTERKRGTDLRGEQ